MIEEKKNYEVDFEDIIFRRAINSDNMKEIAALIYDTDPYIYPFWFNDDRELGIEFLSKEILKPGFIFYYENFYVAYDKIEQRIVGTVGAIDYTTNLDYDYSELEKVNYRYDFTINHYLKELIKEVKEKKYMYFTNVCVTTDYRSGGIGYKMLTNFIRLMHEAGFDEIGFDCLMHNLRGKNLYHSLGFKEVSEGIGFDGTEHSTVEIVFFKKKNTEFSSKDFQMMPGSNVKEIDLKREKYIYESLTIKKDLEKH